MTYPVYILTLHKTYYNKGFFNIGVEVQKYVKNDEGEITLYLGEQKQKIQGRLTRRANQNGTPRVFGNIELKNWIWKNTKMKEEIDVLILNPDEIWLKPKLKA